MSKTTFSGPVASQNGFIAPTFTSTTLPYFEIGNIVYVENLNTLAYGGVDQWYRQDTGAGLGTGGNVTPPGPVSTTYTEGVNYSSNSVEASDASLKVSQFGWFSPSEFAAVVAKPSGTTFSVVIGGSTLTGTLLSGFTEAAGLWSASASIPGAAPGPASSCSSLTI
jgi:hypothetical protein